jgi:type III pantothenate kinase
MNLCVDIGNSFIKVCVFENETIIHSQVYNEFGGTQFKELMSQFPLIDNGIVSTVREKDEALLDSMKLVLKKLIVLDSNTSLPIQNQYQTPETLGKDRLAAVVGANFLFPGRNILVIDAGSAITYDFINESGEYTGGNIAPGLTMRFRALHEFTSKLPLLSPAENMPLLGRNTSEAIIAGVQNSLVFEVESYINYCSANYPDLLTVFTGGDISFFEKNIDGEIQYEPALVPIGLNRILNYNLGVIIW